jgi:hypothetical protein
MWSILLQFVDSCRMPAFPGGNIPIALEALIAPTLRLRIDDGGRLLMLHRKDKETSSLARRVAKLDIETIHSHMKIGVSWNISFC